MKSILYEENPEQSSFKEHIKNSTDIGYLEFLYQTKPCCKELIRERIMEVKNGQQNELENMGH